MARWLGLTMLWAFSSAVSGVLLWVPLGGMAHAFAAPTATGIVVPLLTVWYAPFVGAFAIAYATPVLALLFGAWGVLCRRHPSFDSPKGVAFFALLLALTGACVCAAAFARPSLVFSWSVFWTLMPFYVLIIGGAVMLPRWLLSSLTPGAFSRWH
ncbi:MAG TPA: hypothetical protein VFO11_06965 [Candidatus Polarisedimenticolaceae bacterium]|nr:hypothetical protein [Candidatus Polarisedimenticolaceae bacterium]